MINIGDVIQMEYSGDIIKVDNISCVEGCFYEPEDEWYYHGRSLITGNYITYVNDDDSRYSTRGALILEDNQDLQVKLEWLRKNLSDDVLDLARAMKFKLKDIKNEH